MTKQQIIQEISQWIVTNHSNLITADVLRPILINMVEQPNTLIGNLALLGTDMKTDLVSALNEVLETVSSGLPIHVGTASPYETPPATFNIGDFYSWMGEGGVVNGFYQYNGNVWVEVMAGANFDSKSIRVVNAPYTVVNSDYTIIYEGIASSTITFPAASQQNGRILNIVNRSLVDLNLSNPVRDVSGVGVGELNVVPPETVFLIQSNGVRWYKINN